MATATTAKRHETRDVIHHLIKYALAQAKGYETETAQAAEVDHLIRQWCHIGLKADRRDEAATEESCPDAIDVDAGGERVFAVDEPLGNA